MENIGKILKDRRKDLGYTLQEMSQKTKLSTVQLQAIEEGKIEFFRDDLSYLTYFVRYYANALDIDFDELRDELSHSINAFTNSLSVSKVKEQEAIKENVLKRSKPGPQARKKIDLRSSVLVLASTLILISLAWVGVKVIWPALQSKDPIEAPVVNLPDEDNAKNKGQEEQQENKPEEEQPIDTEIEVALAQEDNPFIYTIKNWDESQPLNFNFEFNNAAWVRFSENDIVLDTPAQGIYESGEKAQIIMEPELNKKLSMNVGYMKGNKIYLNDTELDLDPSVSESVSGIVIEFQLVKDD